MPEDPTSEPSGAALPAGPQPAAEAKATTASGSGAEPEPTESGPALPPLSPQEFRIYNRLAETMDYFHDHFRQMYTTLQTACTTGRRPAGMSLKQFLDEGLRLAHYLEMHHSIEETHLYPLLGRKMPEFRSSAAAAAMSGSGKGGKGSSQKKKSKEECELLRQHQVIHDGMDGMSEYLQKCKDRECELELGVLREKLEGWGDVLLAHLDQEVAQLGAEKMRRHWSVQEMRAMPI